MIAINTRTQAEYLALRKFVASQGRHVFDKMMYPFADGQICIRLSTKGFEWYDTKENYESGILGCVDVIPFTSFAQAAGIEFEEPKQCKNEEEKINLLREMNEMLSAHIDAKKNGERIIGNELSDDILMSLKIIDKALQYRKLTQD